MSFSSAVRVIVSALACSAALFGPAALKPFSGGGLGGVCYGQALQAEVRGAMSAARLGPVDVSVCVIDVDSGQMLAGINERSPVIPASNLKLLTSGAALITLGRDFKFQTRFVLDGEKLYIVGDGDPGFADPKLLEESGVTLTEFIDKIVVEITSRGGKSIREIILDDRVFDRDAVHASWPRKQLDAWYCAPVSGLNFFTNCVEFYISPSSKIGGPPTVRSLPGGSFIEVRNTARTVASDSTDIHVSRGDKASYTVSGSVAAKLKQSEPIEVTMADPSSVLGMVLAERLTAAGATPAGPPMVRLVNMGETVDLEKTVAIVGTSIESVLRRCNVNSQNLYAESLMKRMGHAISGQPGSWQNGAAVVRMLVSERLGSEAGELSLADGSGMSQDNRITVGLLAGWLAALAKDERNGPVFIASMADAGSGKIAERFKGRKLANTVHAKTGFISGVQSLSGYVTNESSKRRIVYCVILNNTGKASPGSRVKEFHEDVVQIVDRYLSK